MKRYIIHSLESGPKAIARILRVFPTERFDERLDPNRFTAREVIAHLSDLEVDHLGRLRSAVAHPGVKVDAIDFDARSRDHHYNDKEVFHESEVFESRREMTVDYLRELSDEDLHKRFTGPNGEEMDVQTYAMSMVSHDMYHLEQLTMYLANEAAVLY